MPPKKSDKVKKTALPIQKAGSKSLDQTDIIKKALEAKFAEASSAITNSNTQAANVVDAKLHNH